MPLYLVRNNFSRYSRGKKKEKKKEAEGARNTRCTISRNDVCEIFLSRYNRMKHESLLIDNYLDRLLVMISLNEP